MTTLTSDELQTLIIDSVTTCLKYHQRESPPVQSDKPDQPLTAQEAARFLNLAVPTIYSKVSRGELPVMKRSKRLYFSSTELMEYLKEGRKKTAAEVGQTAETYLDNNKKS